MALLGTNQGGLLGGLLGGGTSGGTPGGATGGTGSLPGLGGILAPGGLLDLGGLLGGVTSLLDGLLGSGAGEDVTGILPDDLLGDLGAALEDTLAGAPNQLLSDLLRSGLVDTNLLKGILGDGSNLNLQSLQQLLSDVNLEELRTTLDDLFQTSTGGTLLDTSAVDQLGLVDLSATQTLVTNLVAGLATLVDGTLDIGQLIDTLVAFDDKQTGTEGADTLNGGAGNDTINGLGGADNLRGGDGNDIIDGGAGDDYLYGDRGNDTINGGAGHDLLGGGAGVDVMSGGLGDDIYQVDNAKDVVKELKDEGRDVVQSSVNYKLGANLELLSLVGTTDLTGIGNELNNTITGNDGKNRIDGGAGVDSLLGRGGVDTLTGGLGNDVFRFTLASDSGIGAGLRDIITDFTKGQDKIDFRVFDGNLDVANDQALTFLGAGAFHGDGIGEVRITGGKNYSLVSVDADGNGRADFDIQVNGLHNLVASDFLL